MSKLQTNPEETDQVPDLFFVSPECMKTSFCQRAKWDGLLVTALGIAHFSSEPIVSSRRVLSFYVISSVQADRTLPAKTFWSVQLFDFTWQRNLVKQQ